MICTGSGLGAVINASKDLAAALAFCCAAFSFLFALVIGVSSSPFAWIRFLLLSRGGVDRVPAAGGLVGVQVFRMSTNVSKSKKKQAKG
jgi:hypothetical protein